MRQGLGLKLGILLAVFGILASGLTGYYSYTTSRTMLVKAAEHDLLTSTQVLARRFSIALDEVSANVRMLAALPDAIGTGREALLGRQAEARRTALAQAFAAMLSVHPEYFQVRLISSSGHGMELVRVDRDNNKLTRVEGDDLQEKGHFPYVFKTLGLGRGEVYLSKIVINHERGAHSGMDKPTMRVATPVVSDDGRTLGLVVINLDLNRMFDLLKTDLPAEYSLYLTNEWGDYLIHPDPALTFGFDRGRRILLQDSFKDASAILEGKADTVVARLRGPDIQDGGLVAAFYKLSFGDAEAYRFVVAGLSTSLDKVLEGTRQLGANTAKIVAGFSLLAILLAFIASRLLTRPLHMMVKAARRFSREHAMGDLPVARTDEIGQLARSFHDMQVEIQAHLEELHDSRSQLEHLARHDALTGLPNRLLFFDRLEHAVAAARRTGRELAVFFIDLDRFKEINDSLGHAAGDEVLKAVAKRLRGLVREADTVARLGGDEFIVLFDTLDDLQSLKHVAEKIIQGLRQPMDVDGQQLQVSASVGVSFFPRDAGNANELVHKADVAMYLAKTHGENTAHFYAEGEERDS
jgi:diguanylate cyclase (GGDEF)-like protein